MKTYRKQLTVITLLGVILVIILFHEQIKHSFQSFTGRNHKNQVEIESSNQDNPTLPAEEQSTPYVLSDESSIINNPDVTSDIPADTIQPGPGESENITEEKVDNKLTEKDISALVTKFLTRRTDSNEPTDIQLANNFKTLLNEQASLDERCRAAWNLAKYGDEEILHILGEILFHPSTPAAVKAAIAEGLGYSSEPYAKELILSALADKDDIVVRGAIRGLSAIGDKDVIPVLSDILFSQDASGAVLAEAALGLGRIDGIEAYETLVNAYNDAIINGNTDLGEDIIAALGQRDISEISSFFRQILDDENASPSLRVAAIEALEDAQGDTISFLLKYLSDPDSEVRAAAAWALALADEPPDIIPNLLALLAAETDAEVRKRLYQALENQENAVIDNATVQKILAETELETRMAGYDLLAGHVSGSNDAGLIENFNQIVIPELKQIALTAEKLSTRLSAVITLKRANNQASIVALQEIVAQSTDANVIEAASI